MPWRKSTQTNGPTAPLVLRLSYRTPPCLIQTWIISLLRMWTRKIAPPIIPFNVFWEMKSVCIKTARTLSMVTWPILLWPSCRKTPNLSFLGLMTLLSLAKRLRKIWTNLDKLILTVFSTASSSKILNRKLRLLSHLSRLMLPISRSSQRFLLRLLSQRSRLSCQNQLLPKHLLQLHQLSLKSLLHQELSNWPRLRNLNSEVLTWNQWLLKPLPQHKIPMKHRLIKLFLLLNLHQLRLLSFQLQPQLYLLLHKA